METADCSRRTLRIARVIVAFAFLWGALTAIAGPAHAEPTPPTLSPVPDQVVTVAAGGRDDGVARRQIALNPSSSHQPTERNEDADAMWVLGLVLLASSAAWMLDDGRRRRRAA
jgi:hypothetical protein